MARGRKPMPDELKALKGNPGKRKLNLTAASDEGLSKLEAPFFLKGAIERKIFDLVAKELNAIRFIKATDLYSVARWCSYMAKWVDLKLRVDDKNVDVYYETESKHGKMLRAHPAFASMLQIERTLMALEDRTGLNPSSRQAILRGIINAPNLPTGDLFPKTDDPPAHHKPEGGVLSPVGFLN